MVTLLIILGTARLFSKLLHHSTFPPTVCEGYPCVMLSCTHVLCLPEGQLPVCVISELKGTGYFNFERTVGEHPTEAHEVLRVPPVPHTLIHSAMGF